MKKLSKTDYILYRECPNNVWVKWNQPAEYAKFEVSEFEQALAVLGNEIEELARGIFPGGFLIERRSAGAQELTKKLVAERHPIIFQAVFSTDRFLAATDVLKWNSRADAYDLYEIKMSSSEEEDEEGNIRRNKKKELQFEHDLAFQVNVLELCGLRLNKKYLIRLNRKYVRHGALDFDKLFITEDKTEAIEALRPQAQLVMEEAFTLLSKKVMPPSPCPCYYKGRSSHCTAFSFINPNVPAYGVHDLNRIGNSKRYLEELLDSGVITIEDVPLDDRLKGAKLNQVIAHKKNSPIIDTEGIREELGSLAFPLYFLDYETFPAAVPLFDGYSPYQHVVFQYSLHILNAPDGEPKHKELLLLNGDPAQRIIDGLKKDIGPVGTIISWHKAFENSRNKELAKILPEYAGFLHQLVSRTYDLKDIVEKQLFVHPGFKGKSSIKKVLPVLVPELTYAELSVGSGTDAIEAYRQITSGELTGGLSEQKMAQMLEYCKLDTYAMYRIWREFYQVAVA